MALKISHTLCVVLWLSLLLLVFHELYDNFNSKQINTKEISNNISDSSIHHQPFRNRKVLASKFDFAPFHKRHHQQQHERSSPEAQVRNEKPVQSEIDPRYGVEKRLVPTGPNPLHH